MCVYLYRIYPPLGTSERKRLLAEEAYELTDDNFASDLPETLSTFRWETIE